LKLRLRELCHFQVHVFIQKEKGMYCIDDHSMLLEKTIEEDEKEFQWEEKRKRGRERETM